MELLKDKIDNVMIFRLSGRLDTITFPEFEKELFKEIEDGSIYVILDFERLDYISSAGLRAILQVLKGLKKVAGKLVICSIPEYIIEIFEISGLDKYLKIAPSLEEALKIFN